MAEWDNPAALSTDDICRFLRTEHNDHSVGFGYSNGASVVDLVYDEAARRLATLAGTDGVDMDEPGRDLSGAGELDELGLSPMPWSPGDLIRGSDGLVARGSVDDADGDEVCGDGLVADPDASIIAASPDMYKCLREAVVLKCGDCRHHVGWKCDYAGSCPVLAWRAAIQDAAGGARR